MFLIFTGDPPADSIDNAQAHRSGGGTVQRGWQVPHLDATASVAADLDICHPIHLLQLLASHHGSHWDNR